MTNAISYLLAKAPPSTTEYETAPYIICNEPNQEFILDHLSRLPQTTGDYLGFGGLFNLDMIAVARPKEAWICDINTLLLEFFGILQDVILIAKNRGEFISIFMSRMDPKFNNMFFGEHGEALLTEADREGSWLNTDEKFTYIQSLYRAGKIHHRFLDATDSMAFEMFAGKKFQLVYATNISEWLKIHSMSARAQFEANMRSCLQSDTLFVDAFNTGMPSRITFGPPSYGLTLLGPPLRWTVGRLPSFEKFIKRRR
jgi:hypothetical protein